MKLQNWLASAVTAVLFASWSASAVETPDMKRIEVKIGDAISLRSLGGPNLDVIIHSGSRAAVTYSVVDYSQVMRVAQRNIYGQITGYKELPRTSRQTIKPKLRDAVDLPGDFSDGFLLAGGDGAWLYFDTALASTNKVNVVVSSTKLSSRH